MSPEVSIILPAWRRLAYLREAVASVQAQTFSDWELIVADDGSGAELSQYLSELERTPQVRVVRLDHTGNPSRVRNAALRQARASTVAFLDSDDIWLPEKLARQLECMRAAPQRRWNYVAMERIAADGALMRGEPVRPTPEGAIFGPLLSLAADVSMSAIAVRRDLLAEAGDFDESQHYFEDFDLFLRLSLRSEVSVLREPLVRMRSHGEHYSADRVAMLQGRDQLLAKMRPHAESLALTAVLEQEVAANGLQLARALTAAGRRRGAAGLLWDHRGEALRGAGWWSVWVAIAGSFAPAWLRSVYRATRRR